MYRYVSEKNLSNVAKLCEPKVWKSNVAIGNFGQGFVYFENIHQQMKMTKTTTFLRILL